MPRHPGVLTALRDWQLDVTVIAGAETRGSATFHPGGHTHHHDASSVNSGEWGAIRTVTHGRGGPNPIVGPLANFVLARTGRVAFIAAGRANHAGVGGWGGLTTNSRVWGTEACNNGVGERWPDAQLDAYHRLAAALCQYSGFSQAMCHAHFEWAPRRKIDPRGDPEFMNVFRAEVAALLKAGAPHARKEVDDDMIRPDDHGTDVVKLQHDLNRFIALTGPWLGSQISGAGHLPVDGAYGPVTQERMQHAIWRAERWVFSHPLYCDPLEVSARDQAWLVEAIAARKHFNAHGRLPWETPPSAETPPA